MVASKIFSNSTPMGSSHRRQRLVARITIDNERKTPTALCRLVNQVLWLACPSHSWETFASDGTSPPGSQRILVSRCSSFQAFCSSRTSRLGAKHASTYVLKTCMEFTSNCLSLLKTYLSPSPSVPSRWKNGVCRRRFLTT